ncbi:hypothetical protein LOD99_9070 [Oopsacas minuta]|uniref:Uncharacterized protein n=1 Tax=Oopsacas minuta TaxID=111878 RepID=A0AAV7JEK0_9METZ|nr:hypothetical protein LOD99_9070 [Oopsacas minuta]
MDKKYRSEDKIVVFIANCIPAIPETPQTQCRTKNFRHANHQYTRQLIASPPILKAYNYRMGGVDKHDCLVGQHPIPLRSKRGYLRVFFHLLDSAWQHLHELLLQHATTITLEVEGEQSLPLSPEFDTSILPIAAITTTNVMSDKESSDSEQYSSSDDDDL